MENIEKIISFAGLNKNEAKIYLTLLRFGQSVISDIAKNSGIKRATIYQYIDDLSAKDIVRKTVKGKRIFYYPEDPKKLIDIIERKEKKMKEVFPELEKMYQHYSSKPTIRFYEGKEGMRSVYREMTKTSKTLWSMFSADRYFQVFSEKDSLEFVDNIYQNGGQLRDLVKNSRLGIQYVKEKWGGNSTVSKLLPKDFEFSVDLLIAGDNVAMISFDNLVAVIIENPGIAQLQKNLLKFIWKHTK
ncbi:MAG: Sugar-specific transcriptional regulator TrmB family [uncultured bacterium]|nr:MAG: Sugar-specific transcriptional regulator TrmB family [uncultured bacterium]